MSDESSVDERLRALERRLEIIEERLANRATTPNVGEKPTSIREFLNSAKPGTDLERTLFLGHYLERSEANESFNVEDLRSAFARAKEPQPANINDAVNKNIQKGLLMEVADRKGGKKAWVLTNSGEKFVVERLSTRDG